MRSIAVDNATEVPELTEFKDLMRLVRISQARIGIAESELSSLLAREPRTADEAKIRSWQNAVEHRRREVEQLKANTDAAGKAALKASVQAIEAGCSLADLFGGQANSLDEMLGFPQPAPDESGAPGQGTGSGFTAVMTGHPFASRLGPPLGAPPELAERFHPGYAGEGWRS